MSAGQTRVPPLGLSARSGDLPISSFHWRLLGLIGAGLFLDGFDLYLAGGLLGALVQSGWSDLAHNARFISVTFAGMFIGAWLAGVLGDRFGRRFSYQANLLLFGIASLAGAAAPSMDWLIGLRFIMGIGLGADIVAGYVMLSELVPPTKRGRWGSGGPVLLTHGARDRLVRQAMAERIRSLKPGSRLSVFAESGHSPFYEEPRRFGSELATFVAEANKA